MSTSRVWIFIFSQPFLPTIGCKFSVGCSGHFITESFLPQSQFCTTFAVRFGSSPCCKFTSLSFNPIELNYCRRVISFKISKHCYSRIISSIFIKRSTSCLYSSSVSRPLNSNLLIFYFIGSCHSFSVVETPFFAFVSKFSAKSFFSLSFIVKPSKWACCVISSDGNWFFAKLDAQPYVSLIFATTEWPTSRLFAIWRDDIGSLPQWSFFFRHWVT